MKIHPLFPACFFIILMFCANLACAAPVSVLVPSQPGIEKPAPQNGKGKKAAEPPAPPEVDILISAMLPHEHAGVDMEMPQMFAQIIRGINPENGEPLTERNDLLQDMEEIKYLDKKAWGVNMALTKPGLYQYIMEARPRWEEDRGVFSLQYAKVILPVFGIGSGWQLPAGQPFEIMPLSRPFGLSAPALFSGQVILDGKPCPDIAVRMGRINSPKKTARTPWHKNLEAVTNSAGEFSFVLSQPGWWYCEAATPADPLKGPDGQPRPAERSTILWLYVDAPQ